MSLATCFRQIKQGCLSIFKPRLFIEKGRRFIHPFYVPMYKLSTVKIKSCYLLLLPVVVTLHLVRMAQKDPTHDDYCLEQYKYQFQPDILGGKVAFITGGGSGIGFRIAEVLMRHGCDVAIGSRRKDKLEEVNQIVYIICGLHLNILLSDLLTVCFFLQSAKRLMEATGRKCLPIQIDVRKVRCVRHLQSA